MTKNVIYHSSENTLHEELQEHTSEFLMVRDNLHGVFNQVEEALGGWGCDAVTDGLCKAHNILCE